MADRDWAERMLRFDMAMTEGGTQLTTPLRNAAVNRGNIALGILDQILVPNHPQKDTRLWMMDRILEPQTIPHFLEFLCHGRLPNGTETSLPRPTMEDVMKLTQPFSTWAPAPFNLSQRSTMKWIMVRIGSYEDGSRLRPIAKELHAMKSRVWEGIMPLSERRWQDLKLDEPDNFPIACKYIASVIDVFCYLNHGPVRKSLRSTFNLISGHLKVYENAINLARQQSVDNNIDRLSITLLWYEFMKAKYDYIIATAHSWVIDHIERLRGPILQRLATYEAEGLSADLLGFDAVQWDLTNKLHDLSENVTMADTMMFLPTDGYRGDPLPVQDDRAPRTNRRGFLEQPITWSSSPVDRRQDYIARNRYLSRREMYNNSDPASIASSQSLVITARAQIAAQSIARRELRGEPRAPVPEKWIDETLRATETEVRSLQWSYVGYRLCHEHSDAQWNQFNAAFDNDTSKWGLEHNNVDKIRNLCKVRWLDGKDLGINDGDVEAAKKHFKAECQGNNDGFHTDIFLIADADVINSYLEQKASEGFVLAVEADFDPNDFDDEESPGYSGRIRVLGSLLWDDLSAMLKMQNQHLDELWPLAMHDAKLIYRGPAIDIIWRRKATISDTPKEVVAICAIQAALRQLDL